MPIKITKNEDVAYPELPIHTVLAGVIADIQTKQLEFQGKPNDVVEFTVDINDSEIPEGTQVRGTASLFMSPKSKLNKWVTALLGGREPAIGDEIDLEQFLGQEVQFMVEAKEKTSNTSGQPIKFYNISDFVATRRSTQNQTTTTSQRGTGTTGRRF